MCLWAVKCSCDVQYVVMQCGGVEWCHAQCSLMRIMYDVQKFVMLDVVVQCQMWYCGVEWCVM